MKKLILVSMVLASIGTANAVPTPFTLSQSAVEQWNDAYYYAWNLGPYTIAQGDQVVGAVLTFNGLQDVDHQASDRLFTTLMDDHHGGTTMWNAGMDQFWPSYLVQNSWLASGFQIDAHDPTGSPETWSIDLSTNANWTTMKDWLADGEISIGFDPDCAWTARNITFVLTTSSTIPAPGAILLGGIGVSIVGWMRRRRTL